ncbi:MAG: 50S ribosomal protein L32 [Clostridia bacterium]|nr:50S ribosomal protein L32 [Clostridia bacterium]MBQ3928276.1 50S ribosomal protein L32 [Clostridia bacterium]MBQ7728661.1 50S ribosomal protein L32 [Clostridia bacterium]
MAVPKRKVSKARRDKRRSNNSKLTAPELVRCSNPECNEMVRPHHVCMTCGYYGGKKVIDIKTKEDKKA